MDIKKEDIKDFLNKKIRLVLENKYTYVGEILSYTEDYLKLKDKYDKIHLFPYSNIIHLEVVE